MLCCHVLPIFVCCYRNSFEVEQGLEGKYAAKDCEARGGYPNTFSGSGGPTSHNQSQKPGPDRSSEACKSTSKHTSTPPAATTQTQGRDVNKYAVFESMPWDMKFDENDTCKQVYRMIEYFFQKKKFHYIKY